jgi:hypothetical protein
VPRLSAEKLRATASLTRLLDEQGKHDEARAMLADVYNGSPRISTPPT